MEDNTVIVAGEIGRVDVTDHEIQDAVKAVARKLGYQVDEIIIRVSTQSLEIGKAVDANEETGAGDQGIMFGYATNETETHLPLAFHLSNKIIAIIEDDVENNPSSILKGDAKTQVTVDLDKNTVEKILVSVCHYEGIDMKILKYYIIGMLTTAGIPTPKEWIINPAGLWTVGGPTADCGLTGRKIVCDQYGGFVAVGGGAFSGKDLSKVDRSAAYMARNIAVDALKNFNINECEIQLAYGIGMKEPMSINVKTDKPKTSKLVESWIRRTYDLTPAALIETFEGIDFEFLAQGCHYRFGRVDEMA